MVTKISDCRGTVGKIVLTNQIPHDSLTIFEDNAAV